MYKLDPAFLPDPIVCASTEVNSRMTQDGELLDSKEAAPILDTNPSHVNELAKKQEIPDVKKGPQWTFLLGPSNVPS